MVPSSQNPGWSYDWKFREIEIRGVQQRAKETHPIAENGTDVHPEVQFWQWHSCF